jgi:PelA/Pel-15E family pectate lyase
MRNSFFVRLVVLLSALLMAAASSTAHAQAKIGAENKSKAKTSWGGGESRWKDILSNRANFYGSEDSIRIAENVLLYQNDNGGWPKNIDMAKQLSDKERREVIRTHNRSQTIIDNGGTWTQIRFLALMHAATGDQRYADSATRGINFLLEAQYPNGGWPMIYPLRKGYYTHITFNDGAMIGVMNLLRDIAENRPTRDGKNPFAFVDEATREHCQQAIDKGLEVILATQVVVDGKPTVWCAQHDEVTLKPAGARSYELASLSGYESVGIVEYLMSLDNPSPEVRRAIDGAIAWYKQSKIEGQRVKWVGNPRDKEKQDVDRIVVDDPNADPLWARFYEIGTNRPMFVSRDGVIHEHMSEIERERRTGYSWLGEWADDLIHEDYPKWQQKWAVD